MTCCNKRSCEVGIFYSVINIANPSLFYVNPFNFKRYHQAITKFSECDSDYGTCSVYGNWRRYTEMSAGSIGYSIDSLGDWIARINVAINGKGSHGYFSLYEPELNYSCPDTSTYGQGIEIYNNGVGYTKGRLSYVGQNCCSCKYESRYEASNPYQQIAWKRLENGCSQEGDFYACAPDSSYITIGAPGDLFLPPNPPVGAGSDGTEYFSEVTTKTLFGYQTISAARKMGLPKLWSSSPYGGETIPDPNMGGTLLGILLVTENLKIVNKSAIIKIIDTYDDTVLQILGPRISYTPSAILNNQPIAPENAAYVNLAQYAIQTDNTPWGPHLINRDICISIE